MCLREADGPLRRAELRRQRSLRVERWSPRGALGCRSCAVQEPEGHKRSHQGYQDAQDKLQMQYPLVTKSKCFMHQHTTSGGGIHECMERAEHRLVPERRRGWQEEGIGSLRWRPKKKGGALVEHLQTMTKKRMERNRLQGNWLRWTW